MCRGRVLFSNKAIYKRGSFVRILDLHINLWKGG
jgi:hypothetical protein